MRKESRIIKILTLTGNVVIACIALILVFSGTYYAYQVILHRSSESGLFSMVLISTSIILITALLATLYWMNKRRLQAEEGYKELSKRERGKADAREATEDELKGLKASRESYKSMIEGANDAIWTLDRNGKFLSTNRSFEEMTGFRSKELIGRDFSSIVLKESTPLYKKAMADAFKGKAETITIKVLHKYLKALILSVNVSSIMSCGDIIGTVSFGRDVTIKKTFEEHLLRQNKELSALHKMASSTNYALDFKASTREFLKIIIETMKAEGGAAFLLDDQDKKFLKPFCATGVTDEEEFLRSLKGFKIGEGIVGTIALLDEPMTVEDIHEDVRATRPDILGEKFRGFAGAPIKSGGEVFGVIVIYYKKPHLLEKEDMNFLTLLIDELALDLSHVIFTEETMKESERMEERTRANEEIYNKLMQENVKWENILDSIPHPFCIHDRANHIVRTNEAFADKFGLNPKDLVGKKCHEILSQQNASDLICPPSEDYSEEPFHVERVELFDDQYEVYSFPLLNTDREPEGTVHLFMAIAKFKSFRNEMVQREKLSSMRQLVAGVAHEISNPLTGMLGYLQLLLAKEDNETHRTYIERTIKEAEKASKVIKNLLTFARKTKVQKKPADMNSLIENAVIHREEKAGVGRIEIAQNLSSKLPKVMIDENQLQLVLYNILLNAEQAMLEHARKGKITINSCTITQNNKDFVRIEIFDEGPGIPEKVLSRIFDPFFTTREAEKKTGLGLSICSGIIDQHQGEIRARNHEQGAVFTIDLPTIIEEQMKTAEREKVKTV